MSEQQAVLIPELVELIARDLRNQDLTVCVRVNRNWHQGFIHVLHKNIHVYDFDFYSTDSGSGFPSRAVKLRPTASDVGYGGSRVYKYGHFVKSITVFNVRSLKYLGESCTNLNQVIINTTPPRPYPNRPVASVDQKFWRDVFRKASLETVDIWADLITRNPVLTYVRIDLTNVHQGFEKISERLGRLDNLKEVYLYGPKQRDVVEITLDHCSNIAMFGCGSTIVLGPQCKSSELGQPTKIRTLNLQWAPLTPALLANMIYRCPELEYIILPTESTNPSFLSLLANAIRASKCRTTISRLDFTGINSFILENKGFKSLVDTCEALSKLLIFGGTDFPPEMYLSDTLLNRLMEFRFRNISHSREDYGKVLAILKLCPKLRVFELTSVAVDVDEFLDIVPACTATLQRLVINFKCAFPGLTETDVWESERSKKQDVIFDFLSNFGTLEELTLNNDSMDCGRSKFPFVIDDTSLMILRSLPLKNMSVSGRKIEASEF